MTAHRALTSKEWAALEGIGGYIGYIRSFETVCLDGDFTVAELRQVANWLENQLQNGDQE